VKDSPLRSLWDSREEALAKQPGLNIKERDDEELRVLLDRFSSISQKNR